MCSRASLQSREEQVGTMSSHTIFGHGYRLQSRHCVSYPGEAGGCQALPGTFLPRGKGHLETVPVASGAHGSNGPNSTTGPSLHVPSTEVPPQWDCTHRHSYRLGYKSPAGCNWPSTGGDTRAISPGGAGCVR